MSTDTGLCTRSNVTFAATANDNCPGVSYVCVPASGSTFAIGPTTVSCTATDTHGAVGRQSYLVEVRPGERLPVDELKIDKSFVMAMEREEGDAKIVRSTVDLAHNLDRKSVV